MLGAEACRESFAAGMATADVAVVEGMMGLFDGCSPESDAGSTAHLDAAWSVAEPKTGTVRISDRTTLTEPANARRSRAGSIYPCCS